MRCNEWMEWKVQLFLLLPSTWCIGVVAGVRDGTSSLDPASERPVSESQASRGGAGLVGEKAVGSQGR